MTQRSHNIASSPAKSMVIETKNADGRSPLRIRVIVQAESNDGLDVQQINRTIKVPLRDAETSPVKSKGRSRRTNAISPARKDQTRKPTPVRRRSSQSKPKAPMQEAVAGNETVLSDSGVNAYFDDVASPEKPAAAANEHQPLMEDEELEATFGAYSPGDATMLESEEFSMISVDSLTSSHRSGDNSSPAPPSYARGTSDRHLSARNTNTSFMPSSPPVFIHDRVTPTPSDSPPKYPSAPVQQQSHESNIETPLRESTKKSGQALQHALNGPSRESVSRDISSKDSVFAAFSTGTRRQLRESLNVGQGLASQQPAHRPYFHQGAPSLTPSAPAVLSPFHSPIRKDNHNSNISSSRQSKQPNRMLTPDEHDRAQSVPTSQAEGEVQYPSLTDKIQHSRLTSPYHGYDAMSWMATGPPKPVLQTQHPVRMSEPLIPFAQAQATHGDEIDYSLSEIIEPEAGKLNIPEKEEQAKAGTEDHDIWQEEASRDSDEDGEPSQPPVRDVLVDDDLLVKPRRSKLPGTWRRISGANFHYSDSPEPEEARVRKTSATTDNSSRKTSGVLTPPATEDESCTPGSADEEDQSQANELEDGDSVVTPDESGGSASEASNASPDEDDTGLFWHANLPTVYKAGERPPLRDAAFASLAALKRSTESSFAHSSPLRNTVLDVSPMRETTLKNDPVPNDQYEPNLRRRITKAPLALTSPMRRSLLKSSKLATSPLGKIPVEYAPSEAFIDQSDLAETEVRGARVGTCGNDSSMASDARQLHNELTSGNESSMASDARQLHAELAKHHAQTHFVDSVVDFTEETLPADQTQVESGADTTESYQEELNRSSPTRIRVNFNDSMNSSLIAPKRTYPALFEDAPELKSASNGAVSSSVITATQADKKQESCVVARLTSSFWETVTAQPVYATNTAVKSLVTDNSRPTTPDIVLRLQRKYGLLPDRHPFTYTHVRTLHRMLNSTRSRPENSIIPTSGALSPILTALIGTKRSNELDQQFVWTEQRVYVVSAFCSLLLPASERVRLEEIKAWGDSEALKYKGVDSKGRHGGEKVFPQQRKGRIEEEYVADVLVGIVLKEEMNARKQRVREMMRGLESSEAGPFL